jgi:hypothetical protein
MKCNYSKIIIIVIVIIINEIRSKKQYHQQINKYLYITKKQCPLLTALIPQRLAEDMRAAATDRLRTVEEAAHEAKVGSLL